MQALPTSINKADLGTKALSGPRLRTLRELYGLRNPEQLGEESGVGQCLERRDTRAGLQEFSLHSLFCAVLRLVSER